MIVQWRQSLRAKVGVRVYTESDNQLLHVFQSFFTCLICCDAVFQVLVCPGEACYTAAMFVVGTIVLIIQVARVAGRYHCLQIR